LEGYLCANIPAWSDYQLVGSPDTVTDRIRRYMDVGFNHLLLHTATPGVPHEVRREWTRRFALEVAPRFDSIDQGRVRASLSSTR
jgi:alkanesulfonate monooxygenase SsuD/methylene tetrahydromethanopterin reductase-like flavin-dependent oxidoreductase (luciferase family)